MSAFTAEQLVSAMLASASDYQADMLDGLLVDCGYWWECPAMHGFFLTGEACDVCATAEIVAEVTS